LSEYTNNIFSTFDSAVFLHYIYTQKTCQNIEKYRNKQTMGRTKTFFVPFFLWFVVLVQVVDDTLDR